MAIFYYGFSGKEIYYPICWSFEMGYIFGSAFLLRQYLFIKKPIKVKIEWTMKMITFVIIQKPN